MSRAMDADGNGNGNADGDSKHDLPESFAPFILAALGKAGGVDYLAQQARDNPGLFMGLLGKVLAGREAPVGGTGEVVVGVASESDE